MVVHRMKFKTGKVLEVYWIFAGVNKIFMGSVFILVTLHLCTSFLTPLVLVYLYFEITR